MAINESTLDETAAAETLKPGAGSVAGDVGKTELMASVVAAMGGMSKEEINKFQAVLDQFGKNKTPGGVAMNADANKASVAAKGAMKEDLEEMFAGDDMTEEFKEKASTLFEAAVHARVGLEVARIEEEYEEALDEVAEKLEEEMAAKVDSYLDYVAEQWFEDNKIAIESSMKTEAADNFIAGVKALFAEHMIEVPAEDVDIVEDLQSIIDQLEEKLNDEINEKIELTKLVEDAEKEAIFDEVAEGLAATQVEKLRTLAEGLDYTDSEVYRKKVNLVKENYFSDKSARKSSIIVEETVASSLEELSEEAGNAVPSGMQRYVKEIAKITKK